ncbi:MAG: glycerophosphodiester phosphodiesterase family protein, partial [Clostridium perfringens]|nr:glycerophosphodiester phosphodiesterase family protein [Clostridium perfringens]
YENIEKDVLDLIKEYNLERKILISSFNHKALEKVKNLDGNIKLGVLYEKEMHNIIYIAKNLNAYAIHPSKTLVSKELVEKAHNEGLKVNVYTVNEKEDIDRLKNYGVDAIFTDQAKRALKYLK